MSRPLVAFAFVSLPAILALAIPDAAAGGLAATARGVDNKSSSSSNSSSSSSSGGNSSGQPRGNTSYDSDVHAGSGLGLSTSSHYNTYSTTYGRSGCLTCEDQPNREIQLPRPSVDLRLSMQKVHDSDGSYHFDASMALWRVGLFTAFDHYFEQIDSTGKMAERSEDVRVNLFEISAFARLADSKHLKADVRLGFAAATSTHFDSLPGGVIGARVRTQPNEHLALSAEARAMRYQHDINAKEAALGAHMSIFWLGYRALKFDVGPVLAGPEVGLSFRY